MASNNPRIPYVRDGILYRHDGATICRVTTETGRERSGWVDWLNDPRHKSFAFVASNGAHATVIKERRIGSSGVEHFYWYAYRSIGGVKKRVSLGKSERLTLARLSQGATKLAQFELPIPEAAGMAGGRGGDMLASPKRDAPAVRDLAA
jgi:hypothetical protein